MYNVHATLGMLNITKYSRQLKDKKIWDDEQVNRQKVNYILSYAKNLLNLLILSIKTKET